MEKENKNIENKFKPGSVHFLLAHAYSLFFVAIIIGIIADTITNTNLLENFKYSNLGIAFVFLGTGLVYWAQISSSKAIKIKPEENSVEGFTIGPYKYFRHPTYLGLFVMTLGLGILIKSLFSVLFVLVAYLVIKFVFIKKERKILVQKYPEIYARYEEKVKNVL